MKFRDIPMDSAFFDPVSGEQWRKSSSTAAVQLSGGDAVEGGTDEFDPEDEVEPC